MEIGVAFWLTKVAGPAVIVADPSGAPVNAAVENGRGVGESALALELACGLTKASGSGLRDGQDRTAGACDTANGTGVGDCHDGSPAEALLRLIAAVLVISSCNNRFNASRQ